MVVGHQAVDYLVTETDLGMRKVRLDKLAGDTGFGELPGG